MKENRKKTNRAKARHPYTVNMIHTVVVGGFFLICLGVKAFFPFVILPKIQIPLLVLLTLISLVAEACLPVEEGRSRLISALLGSLTFVILFGIADQAREIPLWKLSGTAFLVFGVTDLLYQSAQERSYGVKAGLIPVINGGMLFLGSQCFLALLQ